MHKEFKKRLKSGEGLVGTIVTLNNRESIEILTQAGFDWLFIDAEHGPFSPYDVQSLLQAAQSTPSIVRIPALDEIWVKKILDLGVAGLLIPQINTAEEARKVVQLCHYPPAGERGVGLARAHNYGFSFTEYLQDANQDLTIIVQAEHTDAVANIEDIVAVNGVDAVLVGPYDLSASMGIPGKVEDEEVQAAIKTVLNACVKENVPAGIFGVDLNAVDQYIGMGFSLIAVGIDVLFLGLGAQETYNSVKEKFKS